MPMRWIYEDAPQDMSLTVHKELPAGVSEHQQIFANHREASGTEMVDGEVTFHKFHHCPKCDGWIEGWPNQYNVNTLEPSHLAGRQGREYHCRRCGYEIGFIGRMS